MVAPVEVRRGDDVRDSVPGAVVAQDAAQHRLLGVDRVRRDAEPDAGETSLSTGPAMTIPGRRLPSALGEGVPGQNTTDRPKTTR